MNWKLPRPDVLPHSGLVPEMQAVLIDLSRESAAFLPDAPQPEARIRTLLPVRNQQLESESVVAIFRLLRAWQQIDSHRDALSDIIVHPATVFDAGKLNWYRQAIRTGLQIESETQMPCCFDALVEQGMKKGLDSSSSPTTHFRHVALSGWPVEVVILPRISPATDCGLCLFTVHSPLQ